MSIKPERYFQQKLLRWHHDENRRELPWKGEKDVYRIWLSEIILQQTRAGQGWAYYERFVAAYPTVQQLAAAPQESVYKLWEGLGYYTRCKNLHATARRIVAGHEGRFPASYEGLLALPGIGPYTAAAIASFGFGLPHAVVDRNVYRVLSRFFGEETPVDSTAGKKRFAQLAAACLATDAPAAYNQAIMDFGATVCTPDQPRCTTCPLRRKCRALATGQVSRLPVKEKQTRQRDRWFVYYILQHRRQFAVQQRTAADVWQQLWEFPQKELTAAAWQELQQHRDPLRSSPLPISRARLLGRTKTVTQQLSHQTIHAFALLLQLPGRPSRSAGWTWLDAAKLQELAFPRLIHRLFTPETRELFQRNA